MAWFHGYQGLVGVLCLIQYCASRHEVKFRELKKVLALLGLGGWSTLATIGTSLSFCTSCVQWSLEMLNNRNERRM